MTNLKYGPKITPLGDNESLNTLEQWRHNVLYHLRINEEFRPYLNTAFGKKTRANPSRDLTDDQEIRVIKDEAGDDVQTTVITDSKENKCYIVDILLEQIANFAPTIPRNDIVRDSASVQDVWGKIRLYFNLEKSGALANECWSVKRKPEESPQALFARLKQTYDENLLSSFGLAHVDGPLTEDEEMSPSLHNNIILHWLNILHPQLRDTVTTRFSTQLRSQTYAALFPEISRSVCSLLEELNGEAATNRVFSKQPYRKQSFQNRSNFKSAGPFVKKSCEYCKMTGKEKFWTHNMDTCLFIAKDKLRGSAAAKQIECDDEDSLLQEQYDEFYRLSGEASDNDNCAVEHENRIVEHIINFVDVNASPVLVLNKNNKSYPFVLDTGCTGSIVPKPVAESFGVPIEPTQQRARAADGKRLNIIGQVNVVLHRKNKSYQLFALVCSDNVDLLAGMPFLKKNDIGVRPATDEIIIDGKDYIKYDPIRRSSYDNTNRVTQLTVQSQSRQVILPGESGIFSVNGFNGIYEKAAIEPRWDSHCNKLRSKVSKLWPTPQIVDINNGTVHITNESAEPVTVKRLEHIGQIQPLISEDLTNANYESPQYTETKSIPTSNNRKCSVIKTSDHSSSVQVNPDKMLSASEEFKFRQLLKTYDQVFSPVTSTYNGKFGKCFVEVNIGNNLPPQRKGRVPFYGRDNLQMLQQKFDDLEKIGVFSRPQDIGVSVENTNPSFLVNKPHSTDKRLVTDFASISEYCRPTPSKLPSVDETLRIIAGWNHLITSDMTKSYFQLELKKSSKKFCGVHTPYKGLRVYNVGCMGLPGVEVALEELTCLLLGDLVAQGKVAKLADDLYIGGETPEELLKNFEQVLHIMMEANIKLSSAKTVIAPKSITILGWIWSRGQLRASPHRLSALSTCSPPDTVSALKSFVGTYRFLSRVLPRYANTLGPLEAAMLRKKGNEKIEWSPSLRESFTRAQQELLSAKTITVPIPSDTLWLVTDAAVRPSAVGATLYAVRKGKPHLAGFFNSKLPAFQSRWMPCELEGLGVATALNHFAPLIRESREKVQVLTDSKVVVQAVQKFRRGEFPTSARLTTFLSAVSRHNAQIQHISGSVNLPSDYASRHPLTCNNPESCQICKFVNETIETVVQEISISDLVEGKVRLPFTNRASWKVVQSECPVLRKVLAHIRDGTVPHKKSKNVRSVKKYLAANILISSDGLLVHRVVKSLHAYDQIVVPEQVLDGLLTALHIRLDHPTAYQMKKVFSRYFYAVHTDDSIKSSADTCHHCASIKEIPKSLIHQSTSDPPSKVGSTFTADIIRRRGDKIFIIRENTTSYTLAEHMSSETAKEVTRILIKLCNILKPSKMSAVTVRVDPASYHKSIVLKASKDSDLAKQNINMELGRTKNANKIAIVDKAISELHRELLNLQPSGGSVSPLILSEAVANLNTRLRASGMSSFELWTQRDQVSGEQLPLDDRILIMQQHERRLNNHRSSERSKAGNKPPHPSPKVAVGSLVYLHNDRDKTEARKRYMVSEVNKSGYKLRKFTATLFSKEEYNVKPTEIYKVPEYHQEPLPQFEDDSSDDDVYEDSLESHHESEVPNSDEDSSSDEKSAQESNDEESAQELSQSDSDIPVPPAELTQPVVNKRKSVCLKARLRKRKHLNYKEN
jgi:predicted aspartyl protease